MPVATCRGMTGLRKQGQTETGRNKQKHQQQSEGATVKNTSPVHRVSDCILCRTRCFVSNNWV